MNNILEKERVKIEKKNVHESFHQIFSDHENIFLKKCIIKLYFDLPLNFVYLSFRKNSGGMDVFFCK